jgi:hypothetical protein
MKRTATTLLLTFAASTGYALPPQENPSLPESYTVQPWLNGYKIQNDYEPGDSYTVTPWLNGYRIQNDYDPADSRTVTPWLDGYKINRW